MPSPHFVLQVSCTAKHVSITKIGLSFEHPTTFRYFFYSFSMQILFPKIKHDFPKWLYDNKRNMGTHAVWKGVSLYKKC